MVMVDNYDHWMVGGRKELRQVSGSVIRVVESFGESRISLPAIFSFRVLIPQ